MSNSITAQFVSHNFSGLAVVITKESPEKPFSCGSISSCLEIHINHFAILINSAPQVMLLAIDLYKDFIDEEGISIASVLTFQPAGVNGAELYTQETDRFTADCDASLSEEIFDISLTAIEAIVEPDCITDDVRRASVAFVSIHLPILSKPAL